jgi:hypothetical protein
MLRTKIAMMVTLASAVSTMAWSTVCGQEAMSELPEIMAAAVSKLPEGPRPAREDDNCSTSLIDPETDAGRLVQKRGWGVMSEVAIGEYQLVSFAGNFEPGTSGSCAIQQGNIGVFAGRQLKAILYTSNKTDELIGALVPLENGNVRLWSSGYLESPVADILVGSIGLVVRPVAEEDTFCGGKLIVPNIYDEDITEARKLLIAAGWQPEEQPRMEWGQQPDLQDLGIVEAVDCSGTGFGFCEYSYGRNGASLSVTTAGELWEDNVPSVAKYAVTCEP